MAAGDPVLLNLPNATFLLTAEAGVIIESEERDVESKWKDIFDASKGTTVGSVVYDFMASTNWSAILNGTSGLAIAAPGVAITFATTLGVGSAQNGVSTGGIYTKTAKIAHQGEDLRKVSGTAVQRGAIA